MKRSSRIVSFWLLILTLTLSHIASAGDKDISDLPLQFQLLFSKDDAVEQKALVAIGGILDSVHGEVPPPIQDEISKFVIANHFAAKPLTQKWVWEFLIRSLSADRLEGIFSKQMDSFKQISDSDADSLTSSIIELRTEIQYLLTPIVAAMNGYGGKNTPLYSRLLDLHARASKFLIANLSSPNLMVRRVTRLKLSDDLFPTSGIDQGANANVWGIGDRHPDSKFIAALTSAYSDELDPDLRGKIFYKIVWDLYSYPDLLIALLNANPHFSAAAINHLDKTDEEAWAAAIVIESAGFPENCLTKVFDRWKKYVAEDRLVKDPKKRAADELSHILGHFNHGPTLQVIKDEFPKAKWERNRYLLDWLGSFQSAEAEAIAAEFLDQSWDATSPYNDMKNDLLRIYAKQYPNSKKMDEIFEKVKLRLNSKDQKVYSKAYWSVLSLKGARIFNDLHSLSLEVLTRHLSDSSMALKTRMYELESTYRLFGFSGASIISNALHGKCNLNPDEQMKVAGVFFADIIEDKKEVWEDSQWHNDLSQFMPDEFFFAESLKKFSENAEASSIQKAYFAELKTRRSFPIRLDAVKLLKAMEMVDNTFVRSALIDIFVRRIFPENQTEVLQDLLDERNAADGAARQQKDELMLELIAGLKKLPAGAEKIVESLLSSEKFAKAAALYRQSAVADKLESPILGVLFAHFEDPKTSEARVQLERFQSIISKDEHLKRFIQWQEVLGREKSANLFSLLNRSYANLSDLQKHYLRFLLIELYNKGNGWESDESLAQTISTLIADSKWLASESPALSDQELNDQLHRLSQVNAELAATYKKSHDENPQLIELQVIWSNIIENVNKKILENQAK